MMTRLIAFALVLFASPAMAATAIGTECGGTVQSQQMNPNPERQKCYDNARYNSTPGATVTKAPASPRKKKTAP